MIAPSAVDTDSSNCRVGSELLGQGKYDPRVRNTCISQGASVITDTIDIDTTNPNSQILYL